MLFFYPILDLGRDAPDHPTRRPPSDGCDRAGAMAEGGVLRYRLPEKYVV